MKSMFNVVSSALRLPRLTGADLALILACKDDIRAAQSRPPLSRDDIADICAQEINLLFQEHPEIKSHIDSLGSLHVNIIGYTTGSWTMETGIDVVYPPGSDQPLGVMDIIRVNEHSVSRCPPALIREMLRHEISHAVIEQQLFQEWFSAVTDAFENKTSTFDASQKILRRHDNKAQRPEVELACDALLCKNPHMRIAHFEGASSQTGLFAGHLLRKIDPLNTYPSHLARVRQLMNMTTTRPHDNAPAPHGGMGFTASLHR